MKFRKTFLTIITAITVLFTATSCKFGGTSGETYRVTLNCNGGILTENLTSYTAGQSKTLPTPKLDYHDFGGWFEFYDFSGEEKTAISSTDTGDKVFYAKWQPKVYTVEFSTNGGTLNGSLSSYTYGSGVVLPLATRSGYDFGGWYDNSNLSGSAVTSIFASDYGDKHYYAKWTVADVFYEVTLNAEGGTLSFALDSYKFGVGATLPTANKEYYDFDGWYDSSDNRVTSISATDSGNKSYTAKYTPKTYSVTLNANGGTVANAISSYVYGSGIVLPAPEKKGYSFAGWYANADFSGKAVTAISSTDNGNKQFWAKWEKDETPVPAQTYKVSLNANGGTLTSDLTQYTQGVGAILPIPQKTGYTFIGWYANASLTGNAYTSISSTDTGDKTFYAKWQADKYSVTLNVNGGTLASTVKEYTYGVGVKLPQPTRTGYDFEGWSDGVNVVTEISATDIGDKSYTAQWKVKTYSITYNLDGGTLQDKKVSYTYGETYTLPVPTRDGYLFEGWSDGIKTVTQILSTDTGNKTFTATWSKISSDSLTVTSFGGYNEGAYIELKPLSAVSSYKVSYSRDEGAYTQIDSELVRVSSTTVRADILGISAGDYKIKVEAGGKSVIKDVTVTAHDRSGYAHFNYSEGIGAYNNDGTPKNGAIIIYVNEANKNSVEQKFGSTTYTGIVNILKNLSKSSKPVIIRVLGTVGAATWNPISYKDKPITPDILIANTPGKDNARLSKKTYSQADLISGGFNTLNTSVYSELKNLSSQMKYDGDKNEFDSCWNDCPISGAKNVTVEGIGTDAMIFQWGMTWKTGNSIEIRNLTFDDYTEDACSFEGGKDSASADGFDSKRIWFHNNTVNEGTNYWDVCNEQDKHEGDGGTDLKKLSYITISYNHYFNNHKTGLVGGSDSHTTANVTFHHNYYEKCVSRLPLARQANMHMYNNYYSGSTGTNMSIRAGGYAFIEYCYFDNASNPITTQDGDGKKGVAKVYKCEFNKKNVDTSKYNVTIVTDRTKAVANDNIYNKTFDTDSSAFYYDSVNKKSDVTSLITDVKSLASIIPQLAGTLK